MNVREQRGQEIAGAARIALKDDAWIVSSQLGNGHYRVRLDQKHCTCPDHETRGLKCKHIWAVEHHLQGALPVADPKPSAAPKKTYPQNWRAYNVAQTHEKERFLQLLRDLCDGISEQPARKTGRPRVPLDEAVFAACFKVYSTVSCRRFMSDLRDAEAKGYITKTPHFNTIFNYLEEPAVTPILRALVTETSLPLKAVETDFAVDSSGFTTSRFIRWFDHKYGVVRQQHEWVKVHLMCGVRTNIVTAVEIRDKDASDTKLLPDLVNATAANFRLREVSGDKGYGSIGNYAVIGSHGATPYIAFKSIHTGKGIGRRADKRADGGGLWRKMYHLFQLNRDEYLLHYHKRSNVESTFSMIKAKFRDHVRSKTDVAMVNEVLCKIVCHNICCLIQEAQELGISTSFWADSAPAQELPEN